MSLSGRISDLKMLIALFGNVSIKEIILIKEQKNKNDKQAA